MGDAVFPRLSTPVSAVYPVPPEDLPDLAEGHPFKTMAIWNRKGGVAKTTITHTLGFAYALADRRVLMVDADPQCDLSALLLRGWVQHKQTHEDTDAGEIDYDLFYDHKVPGQPNAKNSLKDALVPVTAPAGDGGPLALWSPADVTQISLPAASHGALFLLPGHADVVDYERKITVAYASNLSQEAVAPGGWNKLVALTARKCGADVVLVDCNPHAGNLNMHIILTSDYLILPCTPDTYSYNAIKSLPAIMSKWATMRSNARSTPMHAGLSESVQIPEGNPRILGVAVMRYTVYAGQASKNFSLWINKIENMLRRVTTIMHGMPALAGMVGTPDQPGTLPSLLVQVPDFNQLSALSHYYGVPVFALGENQLGSWDRVANKMVPKTGNRITDINASVLAFQNTFRTFLERIGSMVGNGPFLVNFPLGAAPAAAPAADGAADGGGNAGPDPANAGGGSAGPNPANAGNAS